MKIWKLIVLKWKCYEITRINQSQSDNGNHLFLLNK